MGLLSSSHCPRKTFAFTGRNKYVLILLLTCFCAVMTVDLWLFSHHFVIIKELYFLLGKSSCFANDAVKIFREFECVTDSDGHAVELFLRLSDDDDSRSLLHLQSRHRRTAGNHISRSFKGSPPSWSRPRSPLSRHVCISTPPVSGMV